MTEVKSKYKGEVQTLYRVKDGKYQRTVVHENGFVYEDYVDVPEGALPEGVKEALSDDL